MPVPGIDSLVTKLAALKPDDPAAATLWKQVDDVFTKGGSTLKAVEAVRELGCEVVLVLALVDRLQGAEELFRRNGITDYRTVFTIRHFGIDVPDDAETAAR